MKIFGRYLAYRLKQGALRTLIFTLLSLMLIMVVVPAGIDSSYIEYHDTSLYMQAIILGVFATLIPILETSAFKNRRNLDTLYFFPIKRMTMALVHYISGFIQVVVIYSIPFFTSWIYLEAQTDYFELHHMLGYYFLSLLVGLMMYSIFIFLFGQANTVTDGVLFCLLWIYAIYLVASIVRSELLWSLLYETQLLESTADLTEWTLIYAPINNLTVIFQDLIEVNQHVHEYNYTHESAMEYREYAYMFVVWAALGIAAAFGYLTTFVRKGAEKAGEISNSWFGYKILIPIYGYCLMLAYDDIGLTAVLIIAMMVIGYVIYRRGFKFKLSDYIMMGIGALPMILGALV